MFTPSTNLRLLNVPLESGYTDTLWFPDVATQTNYFLGKVVRQINDFNFIKKDNTITVNGNVESFYNYNYIMYQNANFTNKWFYAFIDRVEWASNSSTRLYCSTDAIQSWFFDITYYQSFIERQHSTTDVAGDNIVPEPFTPATPCICTMTTNDDSIKEYSILSTCDNNGNPLGGSTVQSVYTGAYPTVPVGDTNAISASLNKFVENGLATAVVGIRNLPTGGLEEVQTITINKHPDTIDGYTPVNKKLLSGAFLTAFIICMGQSIKFNPEFCSGNTINITRAVDTLSGSLMYIVGNYGYHKHQSIHEYKNSELSLTVKYPDGTWAYNQYQNDYNLHSSSNAMYIERQQQYQSVGAVSSVADTLSSGFSVLTNLFGLKLGAAAGGVGSTARSLVEAQSYLGGYDEITQQLQAISESYNAPATGGVSTSNGYIVGKATETLFGFNTPPEQLARLYDNYLTMYGYAQNTFGVPNLHARKCWTYIKVTVLKASGNFPDEDFSEIRRAFKNGVTFWDYAKTFGDYSQDNTL
jgi:hypothetical protein|nr:MAG TPA_asm: Major tail protein [Caudoviricetes sp.]